MTKRDVADIAIVWIGLTAFLSFLSGLAYTLSYAFMGDHSGIEWDSTLPLFLLQNAVELVFTFVLLFRRRCVLDLLFPLAGQTEVQVSGGCAALGDLSFWIKLIGTLSFVTAFIEAISTLSSLTHVWQPQIHPDSMFWQTMLPRLLTVGLSLLIVWQADRIATIMNMLGKSNRTV